MSMTVISRKLMYKVKTDYRARRIPGIIATENGTLIAYFESRRTMSDWADIDIQVIRSTDKGENWETVLTIPSGGDTLNNPVMTVYRDTIHFVFLRNYRTVYHCVSHDDGKTYSEPKDITYFMSEGKFFWNVVACGPGHGIVKDGNIIIPIWIGYNHESKNAHSPSFISTMYSSDNGETWNLGETVDRDYLINPSECALAISDGKVYNSIRNCSPCMMRAVMVSENGISSWSEPEFRDTLRDPVCMGSLDSDGHTMYSINCNSESERAHLTLKSSTDGFKTIINSIEVDTPAGYSDIAVIGEYAYILYEKNVAEDGMYFAVVKIDK